jgi:hypothetical protein
VVGPRRSPSSTACPRVSNWTEDIGSILKSGNDSEDSTYGSHARDVLEPRGDEVLVENAWLCPGDGTGVVVDLVSPILECKDGPSCCEWIYLISTPDPCWRACVVSMMQSSLGFSKHLKPPVADVNHSATTKWTYAWYRIVVQH